ncbi:MAG: CHAT domain-containing protein [Acidobacteriota bacterium]
MSPRTVLSFIDEGPLQQRVRIEERIVEPRPDERHQEVLELGPFHTAAAANGGLLSLGDGLFSVLAGFPPIARQLDAAHRAGNVLLIEDLEADSQRLPWETLRTPTGGFLALSDSPYLGRVVTPFSQLRTLQSTWDGTLRVVAVLAATGAQPDGRMITAIEELEALVEGLRAPGSPPFELTVLSSDFNLGGPPADDLEKAVAALGDPAVKFEELLDLASIEEALERIQPQILHFFCHGLAGDDEDKPRLELSLRDDQIGHRTRGSLILEATTVAELVKGRSKLWLLVLNCCLGANASESVSFARQVMTDSGQTLPAMIAMREAIDRRDAHLFTGSFYRTAGPMIAETAGKARADLRWIEALPAVRKHICRERVQVLSRASESPEWTLPVIYVRREAFEIVGPAPADGGEPAAHLEAEDSAETIDRLEGEIAFLKSVRNDLVVSSPDLPAEKLAILDDRINDLRRQLMEALT